MDDIPEVTIKNTNYVHKAYERVLADGATEIDYSCLVTDEDPLQISIIGDSEITIVESQGTYTEEGASVTSWYDGDIQSFMTTTGSVDVNTIAQYSIVYNVRDSFGNEATATRVVNVVSAFDPSTDLANRVGATVEPNACFTDIINTINSL